MAIRCIIAITTIGIYNMSCINNKISTHVGGLYDVRTIIIILVKAYNIYNTA